MENQTKMKGDIAVAKVACDLVMKGFSILTPVITEQLRFDIAAYKDQKFYRIQVKYCGKENSIPINNYTSFSNSKKVVKKYYKEGAFDYYAIYLPSIDKIIYPSFSFGGKKISYIIPKSPTPFYWYEDFLNFTDDAKKRTYTEFGLDISFLRTESSRNASLRNRKVERPTKEVLEKLIWSQPTIQLAKTFGVSDKAIEKWCKSYNISKPPRGYWMKNK